MTSILTSFFRRNAGNVLKKSIGMDHCDVVRTNPDYAYVDIKGKALELRPSVTAIVPNVPLKVSSRIYVEINPAIYAYGPVNAPTIIEPDTEVGAMLFGELSNTDIQDIDDLDYHFRIYVLR